MVEVEVVAHSTYINNHLLFSKFNRRDIMWTKPAATEMRFGFEVTMYVCNR
jgi:pyrroloquinoline quinone biosynthesis protein A